jgi:hypothetical protein
VKLGKDHRLKVDVGGICGSSWLNRPLNLHVFAHSCLLLVKIPICTHVLFVKHQQRFCKLLNAFHFLLAKLPNTRTHPFTLVKLLYFVVFLAFFLDPQSTSEKSKRTKPVWSNTRIDG